MAEDEQEAIPTQGARQAGGWLLRVVGSAVFLVGFAVVGSFLSAVALYVYGAVVVVRTIWDTIVQGDVSVDGAKRLQVAFIGLTDVFLLGTVLVIVGYGLYQLFLHPGLPVPAWLKIDNLNQLTAQVLEVVGLLLGVTFLAFVVERRVEASLLDFGLATAAVIAALSLLLIVSHRIHRTNGRRGP